jgi:hypothetical protein
MGRETVREARRPVIASGAAVRDAGFQACPGLYLLNESPQRFVLYGAGGLREDKNLSRENPCVRDVNAS